MYIQTYSRALVQERFPKKQFLSQRRLALQNKKTPTINKKKMLHQVGLGCKKIDLLADDTVETVLNKVNNVMLKMYAGIQ